MSASHACARELENSRRNGMSLSSFLWLVLLPVAAALGCTGEPTGPTGEDVVSVVQVEPLTAMIMPGDTVRFTATPKSATGAAITGRVAQWSSSDTLVAKVSSSGLVTAIHTGVARIRATVDGKLGEGAVDVGEPPIPVNAVEVKPGDASLVPGDTIRFSATARAADGTPLMGRHVQWSSSDTLVAVVSGTGLVTAMRTGDARIRATVEGRVGEGAVDVGEPPVAEPSIVQLSPNSVPAGTPVVTIVITGSNFASDAQVLWAGTVRSSDRINEGELRLTIGPSDLTVERSVTIVVRNPGTTPKESAPASFTIGPVAVQTVSVSPNQVTLPVNAQVQLGATTYAADGSVLLGRTITWSSSAQATASVDATGKVTANRVGVVLITAQSEGRFASARIDVIPAVEHVVVSPSAPGVLVGWTVQLYALTLGPGGSVLTGRTVTWSSANPAMASVDENGLVTGIAKGIVRIFAESEGKIGFTDVEVRQLSSGPIQTYELRGVIGSIIMPKVGEMPWVDASGTTHQASLFLAGGELDRDSQNPLRYAQRLRITISVLGIGQVGELEWLDEGTYLYDLLTGHVVFSSSLSQSTFTGVPAPAGELIVSQVIGTAPSMSYRWVIK